jgi:DNA repair protein RadC
MRWHAPCSGALGMTLIKQLPEAERPRERLLRAGERALSDAELVALVWGGGLDRAVDIVGRYGGSAGLGRAGIGELCELPGIGLARATQLRAAIELGRRANQPLPMSGKALRTPGDAAAHLGDMAALEEEEFHVLALDGRHRIQSRFVAARGSSNMVQVVPRDLLRRVLRESAAAIIVAHNHPSGDPSPSPEDLDLTRRLFDGCHAVGIGLLDHLVIGRSGFHSFSEEIRGFQSR